MKINISSALIGLISLLLLFPLNSVASTCAIEDGDIASKEACEVAITKAKMTSSELSKLADQWNLPSGAMDGVNNNDLLYLTFKQILGDPFAKVTNWTSTPDPSAPSGENPGNVTVSTALISIMSGVAILAVVTGALITGGTSLFKANSTGSFMDKEGEGGAIVFRTGLSLVGTTPQPSFGGLSLSQLFTCLVIILSIGLGSTVYKFGLEKSMSENLVVYNHPANMEPFLASMRGLHCLRTLEAYELISPNEATVFIQPSSSSLFTKAKTTFDPDRASMSTKVWHYNFGPKNICGQITINAPVSREVEGDSLVGWSPSDDEILKILHKSVESSLVAAMRKLVASNGQLDKAMQKIIQSNSFSGGEFLPPAEFFQYVGSAYEEYKTTIANGSKSNQFQNKLKEYDKKILKRISEYGMATGGSVVFLIGSRQEMIANAFEKAVAPINTNEEELARFLGDSSYAERFVEETNKLALATKQLVNEPTASEVASELNTLYEVTTSDSFLSEFLGDSLMYGMELVLSTGQESGFGQDPIVRFRTLGNYIMGIPVSILAATEAAKLIKYVPGVGGAAAKASEMSDFVSNKASGFLSSGDGGLIKQAGGFLMAMFIQTFFVLGIFLSQAVPAIPFMMYNTAIFGFVILGITLIAITPIALISSTLKMSQGAFGGFGPYFLLNASLMARPVTIVIGLFLANACCKALFWLYDGIFVSSVKMMQSGGFSLGSAIGIPMLWGVGGLLIIYKSYSLINDLSVYFTKAIGADRYHHDFGEQGAQQKAEGVMNQASSASERAFAQVK